MSRLEPKILEAAVKGEPAAIEAVLATTRADLRRFARQVCATPEDAEDAVQETLWIISQKIGTLRVVSAFFGWAARIVKNECHRLLRRAFGKRERQLTEDPPAPEEGRDLREALKKDIAAALTELPEIYREVVLMRDIEERTAAEVAARLGIAVDAVKSRLHRARTQLRVQLAHWV